MSDPLPLLEETRAELGDIFKLSMPGLGDWIFLCTPELSQEMFRASEDHLRGGAPNFRFIGWLIGENATFSLDGELHASHRRLISPYLTASHSMHHIEMIRKLTFELFDRIEVGSEFRMLDQFNILTLKSMVRMVFGDIEEERLDRLATLTGDFFLRGLRSKLLFLPFLQWNLGRFSPWGRILWMQRQMFEAIGEEVDRRLADPEGYDGILADIVRGQEQRENPFSRTELLHETVGLLFGAQETTSKILTWTMAGIVWHDAVRERAVAEIDRVVGDGPVTAENISQLGYIDALALEGARHRPASPVSGIRLVKQELEIGGYRMPEGAIVAHAFGVLCQNAETFPSPDEFDPEHFCGRKLKPHSFRLFGGGNRTCPGKGLATVEMTVVLATMLKHFDFEACTGDQSHERQASLYIPKDGLPTRIRAKRTAG